MCPELQSSQLVSATWLGTQLTNLADLTKARPNPRPCSHFRKLSLRTWRATETAHPAAWAISQLADSP